MSSEYSQRRWVEFKTLVAALVKSKGDRELALAATAEAHPKRTFILGDVDKAVRLATGKLTPKVTKPVIPRAAATEVTVKPKRTRKTKPIMVVVPNFLAKMSSSQLVQR